MKNLIFVFAVITFGLISCGAPTEKSTEVNTTNEAEVTTDSMSVETDSVNVEATEESDSVSVEAAEEVTE